MNYKIGEFCSILGISPDTLRYYDRCNLLSTAKNPVNKYRTFTRKDALDIWNVHMLRSLDMGLRDIERLRSSGSFTVQKEHLHIRENALSAEIEKMIAKRERLRQLSRLYDAVHNVNQVIFQEQIPANYALYVLGEGCKPNTEVQSEISNWVACLPYTYFAVEISFNSLTAQREDLDIRLGLGILEANIDKAELVPHKETVYTPMGNGVRFAVITNDVFCLSKNDFSPLYAFLEENKMRISGPASGRIISSTSTSDNTEYIIGFSIPVFKE
jgi:DNA-binding transcriptional MerR regulator